MSGWLSVNESGRDASMIRTPKRWLVRMAAIMVTASVLCACAAGGADNRASHAASFETTPCPQPNIAGFPDLDFPSTVQCGYLTVPENRALPDGRHIRIFVMRAPAVADKPRRDPLVYLSGGPGGAGSFEAAFMMKQGINAGREVIF